MRIDPPKVDGFSWSELKADSPRAGKTLLRGPQGPIAIFDFYNYVTVLKNSLLLVWHQRHVTEGPTSPLRFTVVNPLEQPALKRNLKDLCQTMADRSIPLLHDGPVVATAELDTTTVGTDIRFVFAPPIAEVEELLVLCHSSGVGPKHDWNESNLALMSVRPAASSYRLYAQDWFNKGGWDYGYQWATRVVRNPETGRVHGEGFRIEPFVLDETLTKVAKGA